MKIADSIFCRYVALAGLLLTSAAIAEERHKGTAVVIVGDGEYTIPIECNDASRPELGFSTEPSRITHKATGRSSRIRLRVRPWKETPDLVVSLDRYVAWVPAQESIAGVLEMTLDMSPASGLSEGMPVALTYDMWMQGERPQGLEGASFKANCSFRDPAAPAFRKLQAAGE